MPATEPEQMHGLFEQAFNAGDIEALMALYEPDAALVPQPGAIAEGSAAIRESLSQVAIRGVARDRRDDIEPSGGEGGDLLGRFLLFFL